MAFKRLSREQFLALAPRDRDDYRYAMARHDRRTRSIWFWSLGAAITGGLFLWGGDDGMQQGLLSALGLWLVFLAIR